MSNEKSVVVVEDDFLIAIYLEGLCTELSVPVVGSASSGEKAVTVLRELRPTHVLMDVRLADNVDGIEVARAVHPEMPDMRVIYVTGSNEPETFARIEADHPYRVLRKPIDPSDLAEALV